MSACVICDRPCVPPRRTYCSATCAAVLYAPRHERTLRDQVQRDLFLAREAWARSDARTHEMATRITYLAMWLEELDRTGAGKTPAHPARVARIDTSAQLALTGVA
jgi:hypothetical protein